MRNSVVDHIYKKVKKDKDIILLTGDLGFGVLDKCFNDFPENFINVGISEQNLTGLATGLAMIGKKVLTYSIGNFNTFRCLEQIRNDAAYHEVNVTILSVGGGFSYGQLGYSHHATEDYGVLKSLPNIDIYTPGSKIEAIECLSEALNTNNVSYIRIDKSFYPDVYYKDLNTKIGVNEIIKGQDNLIIGIGGVINEAIDASNEFFEKKNYKIGIVSISKLKNIDSKKLINIISGYNNIITIEEHNKMNGLSSTIKEILYDNSIFDKKLICLGMDDIYSTIVGDQNYLRNFYKISKKQILKIIYEKRFSG